MLLEMNVSMRRGNFDLTTNLSVQDESMGLIGRSGAGKSTILGLLAGTLMPESGRIALDGKILFDSRKGIMVPREQRPIGAVLQYDRWPSDETVNDGLSSAHERTLRQRRTLKPKHLIEFLDIGHLLGQAMGHLSTGELQRVLLAKALLKSPALLLLDDSLAAMGYFANSVTPFLKRVRSELNLPLFYASHALGDIVEFSDKIVVVSEGRAIQVGLITELLRNAELIQKIGLGLVENKIPAMVARHDIVDGCTLAKTYGIELVLPLRPDLPLGSWVTVSIPANEIALSRTYLPGISIQNQIKGRICALIPHGNGMLVQIDCGKTWLAGITLKACRDMDLQEGDTIYCLAKTQAFSYCPHATSDSFSRLFKQ
ncbi:MAG: ATP-binding cassette domain-containing protein [Methylovulum sp.]|uniref:ATP-binding cassette domain-containing protein n=1 Tax=Methylovulum sp. TaxID=1916980 RepID=UPI0026177554|nr:ATP-binding cassette domain-containing protein [Methylovulum sp.]MDD2725187.1 ATP-binding cassette domain-containing protein [Methylovulum sp.]MDD5124380.1 ATP-binding cassette domain-containing protein [Methylovulum sp.]